MGADPLREFSLFPRGLFVLKERSGPVPETGKALAPSPHRQALGLRVACREYLYQMLLKGTLAARRLRARSTQRRYIDRSK